MSTKISKPETLIRFFLQTNWNWSRLTGQRLQVPSGHRVKVCSLWQKNKLKAITFDCVVCFTIIAVLIKVWTLKYAWNVCCAVNNHRQKILTSQKPQTTNSSLLVTEQIIFVLFQHSVFSQVNSCFSFLIVCNQGTSGGTVAWMFSRLPTYSKSNRLVIQKNISRDSAIRNENSLFFYSFCHHVTCPYMGAGCCRVASKMFLSKIVRCDRCDPLHCSWGTADLRCFKFLIRQLETLNKMKINCSP